MTAENVACPLSKGERILVAVDGSSNSDFAVDQALSMAATCNSQFFAISVADIYPVYMEGSPDVREKVVKETEKILHDNTCTPPIHDDMMMTPDNLIFIAVGFNDYDPHEDVLFQVKIPFFVLPDHLFYGCFFVNFREVRYIFDFYFGFSFF